MNDFFKDLEFIKPVQRQYLIHGKPSINISWAVPSRKSKGGNNRFQIRFTKSFLQYYKVDAPERVAFSLYPKNKLTVVFNPPKSVPHYTPLKVKSSGTVVNNADLVSQIMEHHNMNQSKYGALFYDHSVKIHEGKLIGFECTIYDYQTQDKPFRSTAKVIEELHDNKDRKYV